MVLSFLSSYTSVLLIFLLVRVLLKSKSSKTIKNAELGKIYLNAKNKEILTEFRKLNK